MEKTKGCDVTDIFDNIYKEKELEDLVCKNGVVCVNKGYFEVLDRQVNIGNGIIDVIGMTDENILYVCELKADLIDGKSLSQLLSYISTIKKILPNQKICGVLIGKSITNRTYNSLHLFKSINFVEYKYLYDIEVDNEIDKTDNHNPNVLRFIKLIKENTLDETPSEHYARIERENNGDI